MRKKLLAFLPFLALAAGAVILNACGSDDPTPPTASFTYVADGRDVTFTSTSTNATTYSWDFGDGSTSTDQNPKHTFAAYGKFTVKLSVTGDGGTANSLPDELTLAKTSGVVIDGNFSEWADVAAAVTATDADGGTIKSVKVDYDANNIYFYVEGTSNLRGFFDVYFDTDADTLTGYFSGWYPRGFGADYLSEGDFAVVKDAQIFKDKDGVSTVWDWDVASEIGAGAVKSSALGTAGSGKAIEFSFTRSAFTNLSAKGFAFAVVDVDGTTDPDATVSWAKLGSLPADNEGGARPQAKMSFFDLTK